jgi:hypothetical protein
MLRPWARVLQIGVAALGLLNCPMTLASATVLLYFLKKETARHFTRAPAEPAPAGDAIPETAFAATVLAMTALGALATALLAAYARRMGP